MVRLRHLWYHNSMPIPPPSPPPTHPDIRRLIQEAADWTYDARARRFEALLSDSSIVPVTRSALSGVDSRLPLVLRSLARNAASWKGDWSCALPIADTVRATLAFWGDKKPLIAWDVQGSVYVGAIHAIIACKNGMIHIHATTWRILKQGREAYVDGVSHLADLSMQRRVLAEHYPCFESRLAQAEVLGLTPVEMAAHIFSEDSIDSQTLPLLAPENLGTDLPALN
jgi:hypothetical protein